VLSEITLRIISPPSPFTPLLPLRPYVNMKLDCDLKGVSTPAVHTTNMWGMRGDPPPDDWDRYETYITIGGSTTQCFYLDASRPWPSQLQSMLRTQNPKCWVGNGGLDGQSSRSHLIFMREVIPKLKPDNVLILMGINDLGLSMTAERLRDSRKFDEPSLSLRLFGASRLLQILYVWKRILLDDDVVVVDKAGHRVFNPVSMAEPETVPEDLKSFLSLLPEYRKNIENMIEISKQVGSRLIFMTQPMLFEDTPYWRGQAGSFYWIKDLKGNMSAATYSRLLDQYNETLKDVCRQRDIEVIDVAAELPHEDSCFYDSVHMTDLGAERTARIVFNHLMGTR